MPRNGSPTGRGWIRSRGGPLTLDRSSHALFYPRSGVVGPATCALSTTPSPPARISKGPGSNLNSPRGMKGRNGTLGMLEGAWRRWGRPLVDSIPEIGSNIILDFTACTCNMHACESEKVISLNWLTDFQELNSDDVSYLKLPPFRLIKSKVSKLHQLSYIVIMFNPNAEFYPQIWCGTLTFINNNVVNSNTNKFLIFFPHSTQNFDGTKGTVFSSLHRCSIQFKMIQFRKEIDKLQQ